MIIKFLLFSLPFFIFFSRPISSQILPSSPRTGDRQGEWNHLHESIGISVMHMQLLHNNKVVMFDRTDFGPSNISLPGGRCRHDPSDTALQIDCTAHSVLYDVATNDYRPLMVQTDTWCSSGAVLPNGTFVQTGGFNDGDHAVRAFSPCDNGNCDWIEYSNYLLERRWYATNQILPDGRIIIVGGRRQFNYEFYPRNTGHSSFHLNFLRETHDNEENNLYPFIHLLPDGNLFIFANTKSVLFDYHRNRVIKQFPEIPGGDPRNYPSSGSSILLPLNENNNNNNSIIEYEIMVCGGAPKGSYLRALRQTFTRAISTCGRLKVSDANSSWTMEDMPLARVMGDMLLLPTGDLIIINGAGRGTAGWEIGRDPVSRPIIYRPTSQIGQRFSVMAPSPRPRMYHSSAILLSDGRILVGGSNPHTYYNFTNVEFPTDLSLESFSPPYLSYQHEQVRPRILNVDKTLRYGKPFMLSFYVREYLTLDLLSVRIIAPSFTTHSFAMNQRMVVMKTLDMSRGRSHVYNVNVVSPSTAEIAPPGYYMLFVVHANIPSTGTWVRIE